MLDWFKTTEDKLQEKIRNYQGIIFLLVVTILVLILAMYGKSKETPVMNKLAEFSNCSYLSDLSHEKLVELGFRDIEECRRLSMALINQEIENCSKYNRKDLMEWCLDNWLDRQYLKFNNELIK